MEGRHSPAQHDLSIERHAKAAGNSRCGKCVPQNAPRRGDRERVAFHDVHAAGNQHETLRRVIAPDDAVTDHGVSEQTENGMIGHTREQPSVEDRHRRELIGLQLPHLEPRKCSAREVDRTRGHAIENAEPHGEAGIERDETRASIKCQPTGGVDAGGGYGSRLTAFGTDRSPRQAGRIG